MTKSQKNLLQYLRLLRDAHTANVKLDGWFYKGPADLLIREGQWYGIEGEVVEWKHSVPRGCFRNAAMYAMEHRGCRYVEGYATSIIPVHHAWCVDQEGHILEVTWDELGVDYFGVQFRPQLVFRGAALFNAANSRIYKRQRKTRKNLKGVIC